MALALLPLLIAPVVSSTKPHILLIVADDLGWNDVSFHGSEQIPTPNLDKLAHSGVILNNYYVQPVCSPTRSSILTGRHVIHSGIYDPDCGPGTTYSVPFNFSMLPVPLKSLGYESHAVGKWHCGMFSKSAVPTGKGFDSFLGYYGGAEDYFTHQDHGGNDMHDDKGADLHAETANKGEYSTFIYTNRAISIINKFAAERLGSDADDGSRLFMYLAYQAIHSPDQVPSAYEQQFKKTIPNSKDGVGKHRRTVAGMVSCLDEGIGNVTNALRAAQMLNDTLIIFTTDNGGPAQGFNNNMASNWPLRGMKRTLWQGGVRGTGFVHGPGIARAGEVIDDMIHATDWFPTILAAASGEGEEWQSLMPESDPPFQLGDGVNVWDTLSKGEPSPRTEVIIEAHPPGKGKDDGNGQAIIVGDLKLILEKGPMWHGPPNDLWYESGSNPSQYKHTVQCGPAPDKGPLPPALFNISADPCEYVDLKDKMPQDYQRVLNRLKIYQQTAVSKEFHHMPLCKNPSSPLDKPVDGTWMPVCP